jgi:type II secretory pathway predicted ATPase ExeA
MFLNFFGLNEQPFGVTPDPRFLYMSPAHEEAFASLVYGIETGRGFAALIAGPGLGKTTVLLRLMERLQDSARTAFLFQTHLQSGEFLKSIVADLGVEPASQNLSDLQRQFTDVLVQESRSGKRVVVAIDEAQNLDNATLEMVRMLSNFETPRAKLLQIILVGQKELADKLARPELEQLRQRVSVITHFPPFPPHEVAKYIEHRLRVAGYKGRPLFTPSALRRIAEQSRGIPRDINNLCFHALSLAFAKNQKQVDDSILAEVLTDLNLHLLGTEQARPRAASGAGVGGKLPHASGQRIGAEKVPVTDQEGLQELRRAPSAPSALDLDNVDLSWHANAGSPVPRAAQAASRQRAVPPPGARRAQRSVLRPVLLVLGVVVGVWAAPRLQPGFDYLVDWATEPAATTPVEPVVQNQDQQAPPPENSQTADLPPEEPTSTQEPVPLATPISNSADSPRPAAQAEDTTRRSGRTSRREEVRKTPAYSARVEPVEHSRPNPYVDDLGAPGQPGRLVVQSSDSGARISINGRSSPEWVTPHLFSLVPGVYNVSVTKDGYMPWTRQVRVEDHRENWLVASFEPDRQGRGRFFLETDPPGSQVYVDGRSYGTGRVEADLPVGWHVCEVVTRLSSQPVLFRFYLEAGEILTKKVHVYVPEASPEADAQLPPKMWNQQSANPGR